MSDSDADTADRSASVHEEGCHARAAGGCHAAMRAGEAIGGAIQRHIPTSDEVRQSTERLRASIRAQPIMAVVMAVGLGLLLGRLTSPRRHIVVSRRDA